MREYKYKAVDSSGKTLSGNIEATDKRDAQKKLFAMGLKPLTLKGSETETEQKEESKNNSQSRKGGGEKVALQLVKKLQQLCGTGGMPVSAALKALSQRALEKKVKNISKELYKDLTEGKTLADSMSKFPDTFDTSIVHLVEAGESTANLEFVFKNIIEYIEERQTLRKNIISALAYPVFLCTLAMGVVLLFLFFMLPRIKLMMDNLGAGENAPIKMMNAIGDFITVYTPFLALIVAGLTLALYFYRKTQIGKIKSDSIFLKIPLLGKIIFDSDVCRFSNLSSTLFDSGVNTTETFRLAEKSIKNSDMRNRFQQFRVSVNDGAPISAALQRFNLLGDEDLDLISVGERTGSLVHAFSEINNNHRDSLNKRIKFATVALGGIALGGAFFLVFIFAMGIVLSILGLSQSLTPQ